jgi:hypothetical protein
VRALLTASAAALVLVTALPGHARAAPSISAYRGLGTWVSIFGAEAYSSPDSVASAIAARGVKTVYMQTGNYSQPVDVVSPVELGIFVDALHARGVRVVAWYLPGFRNPAVDLRRALAAIRFQTPAGGRFDGFALDIESSAVKRPALRTRRVIALSRQLRAAVGRRYALGAIIPAPRGMEQAPKYWPDFPYAPLAGIYDVFLPMVYWTFSVKGPDGAYGYLAWSLAILRAATGNPRLPIHLVGGTTDDAKLAEVRAFAQVALDDGRLAGFSLFDWFATKPAAWPILEGVG